jgi:hypothetical protein
MAASEMETIGYECAMSVVESIIEEMIGSGFDYATLEELRQRMR